MIPRPQTVHAQCLNALHIYPTQEPQVEVQAEPQAEQAEEPEEILTGGILARNTRREPSDKWVPSSDALCS